MNPTLLPRPALSANTRYGTEKLTAKLEMLLVDVRKRDFWMMAYLKTTLTVKPTRVVRSRSLRAVTSVATT